MKIEVLFPEICNLCGDLMNVRYLQQSCPEIEVIDHPGAPGWDPFAFSRAADTLIGQKSGG